MRLRESLRSFGFALSEHPWMVAGIGAAVTSIVVCFLFAVLHFQHVEREHRQLWIEGRFESFADRNNELLARVQTELSQLDLHDERSAELLASTREALNLNREEMRQLRIAVLQATKPER